MSVCPTRRDPVCVIGAQLGAILRWFVSGDNPGVGARAREGEVEGLGEQQCEDNAHVCTVNKIRKGVCVKTGSL